MLLRMYQRWAQDKGFKVELLDASRAKKRGSKTRPSPSAGPTPTA